MSVYQLTVAEKLSGRLTSRYMVEAESAEIACETALGVHAMLEKVDPKEIEVTAFMKTDIRRCITTEFREVEAA